MPFLIVVAVVTFLSCAAAGLEPPPVRFVCTVQLARRTWQLQRANLPSVCDHIGFHLRHQRVERLDDWSSRHHSSEHQHRGNLGVVARHAAAAEHASATASRSPRKRARRDSGSTASVSS
jgi:DNA polymerase III epsilon subunit-like protein